MNKAHPATFWLTLFVWTLLLATANAAGLMYFTQPNCPPCQKMKPVIAELQRNTKLLITIHDISREYQFTRQYNIRSTPTLILYDEDGEEAQRWQGVVDAATILRAADRHEVQWRPHWQWTPKAPYHVAAVQVYGPWSGNSRSMGSGVYVECEGMTGVLTAAHCIPAAEVVWQDGTKSHVGEDQWRCKDRNDVAFLKVSHATIKPLKFASRQPQVGDPIEVLGFGGPKSTLRHYSGKIIASPITSDFKLSCNVAAGDSGGAILNAQHEVISVVSAGTDGEFNNGEARAHPRMIVPRWTPLRDFLARVRAGMVGGCPPPPGMTPLPPRCPDGGCDPYEGWYPPEQPTPPTPQPSPQPVPLYDERLNDLEQNQQNIQLRIGELEASLRAEIALAGIEGPRGPPGPPGPPGPAGQDATIDEAKLVQAITQSVVANLQLTQPLPPDNAAEIEELREELAALEKRIPVYWDIVHRPDSSE